MAERKISYLNRTFDDYKQSLIEYTRVYYPEIANDLDDASIGTWLIELVAAVGDNLSYYIDKAYNETNLESAELRGSVYALARSNGFRVPGPKGAMTELEFTCELPPSAEGVYNNSSTLGMPSWTFAPIIKKGTRVVSSNGQYFETDEDLNFAEQFDQNGNSNRDITPLVDSNNRIVAYRVSKTCTATAGISKIYKMVIPSGQIKPFMEVIIPDKNVMGIESVIFKDGANFQSDPCMREFMIQSEFLAAKDNDNVDMYRFFEVESLLDNYRWGDDTKYKEAGDYLEAVPQTYQFSYYTGSKEGSDDGNIPMYSITKGQWKPLTQKFITEYTDNGYLKIIFGGGEQVGQDIDIRNTNVIFSQNQISNMVNNNMLGKTPKAGTTMFVLYRVGGGAASNVAKGTINSISYLDAINNNTPTTDTNRRVASAILTSIKVTNTIPSVLGKDAPSVDEIRAMIKYNSAAQNRCITVKDYENRIQKMPSRYGCPFRVGALEENNKIMMYLLMINHAGQLSDVLPSVMIDNIINYMSAYRSLNDYVEIKSGRIVNLSFEVDIYSDKNYNTGDVVSSVINTVKDYMDINKHVLGEDIYVSDIEKEISKLDGVLNLIDLRVYNEFGSDYSSTRISQETVDVTDTYPQALSNDDSRQTEIDLDASDYILNSESDEMFEIKYPDKDIRVRVKSR